jgi:hypothetical protein
VTRRSRLSRYRSSSRDRTPTTARAIRRIDAWPATPEPVICDPGRRRKGAQQVLVMRHVVPRRAEHVAVHGQHEPREGCRTRWRAHCSCPDMGLRQSPAPWVRA